MGSVFLKAKPLPVLMAEREGFEPSKEVSPLTRLAGERLQPARPSLLDSNKCISLIFMAEGVGFEPTELLHSTVFKTAAFDHSAIPPNTLFYIYHLGNYRSIYLLI